MQHDAFLEVTHHLSTNHFFFTLIHFDGLRQNALTQRLFMQFWFFIQPLGNWQIEVEIVLQTFLQPRNIPHFFQRLWWNVGINGRFEHIFTNAVNGFAHIADIQQFVTLGVNGATLIVSHVIIFQQLLTNVEVTAFNFTLGVGNRFSHPRVFNGFAWLHTQFTHHAGYSVGSKNTHQRIFHRQVETGRTSIPLTTRTTAQLVIDTTGFVTLGTDDMQATCCQYRIVTYLPVGFNFFNLLCGRIFQRGNFCLPATTEHNICTTTRHIGRDSHRSRITCLSNNRRFVGVEFGVQDVVLNTGFGQFV